MVKRVLTQMRETFLDHHRWTRETSARNSKGDPTSPFEAGACRWCAAGLLGKLTINNGCYSEFDGISELLNGVAYTLYDAGYVDVNDNLGRKAILNVIDKALTLVE